MEEGRGTLSSQDSTQSPVMPPPRRPPPVPAATHSGDGEGGSGGAAGSGASGSWTARKKNLKSHVWNYFSRHPTDDPSRINVHCEICIQLGKSPDPFRLVFNNWALFLSSLTCVLI
ncbi:hypothetical protein ACET3Z_017206 [Daucus carota]